jgi:cell division transport system permease protein
VIEAVTADVLPPSFRVVPLEEDPDAIQALGDTFEGKPGVREVVFAFETVQKLQGLTERTNRLIMTASVALLLAALLLIVNTIRMAMFARRREIEVMKLVGATNWFIRVPFMLEGLVQGLLGAGGAIVSVIFLNQWFDTEFASSSTDIPIFQNFTIASNEVGFVFALLVAMGSLLGIGASAIAVTRFLDV